MSKDHTPGESGSDADAEQSPPMNRAERRAKGKKPAQQGQFDGKQKFSPKNPAAHGHRLWSNRRSG